MSSLKKKILMIGCGGIGCELLKHLCSSSNTITILDFDTIDPTNLNRQFLFTKYDINKYKSEVAALKYKSLGFDINFLVKNIFECDLEFFKSFDTIFNCLDNNESRRFVNLMCRFTNKTVIDGGSGGWLGQSLYFGKETECFACVPRGSAKNLVQVCSVHGIPTTFVHCLIWAKEFLNSKINEKNFLRELKIEMKSNIKLQESNIEVQESNITLQESRSVQNKDDILKYQANLAAFNQETEFLDQTNGNSTFKKTKLDFLNSNNQNTEKESKMDSDLQIENTKPQKMEINQLKQELIKVTNENTAPILSTNLPFKPQFNVDKFNHLKKKFTTKNIGKFIKISKILTFRKSKKNLRSISDVKVSKKYLKIIFRVAKLKSKIYFIKPYTLINSETIINSIVPSICTTNSIVSCLMILSYNLSKNFYISKGQILSFELNLPNNNCLVCNSKKLIFYHGKCTFTEFLVFFQGKIGRVESVYTDKELLFDRMLLKKKEEVFDLESNCFFYVKTSETYFVYNFLRDGTLFLEEV